MWSVVHLSVHFPYVRQTKVPGPSNMSGSWSTFDFHRSTVTTVALDSPCTQHTPEPGNVFPVSPGPTEVLVPVQGTTVGV